MAPILMSCTGKDLVRITNGHLTAKFQNRTLAQHTDHKHYTRGRCHVSRLNLKPIRRGGITRVYPFCHSRHKTLFMHLLFPGLQSSSSISQTDHAVPSGHSTTGGVPSQAAVQLTAVGASHVPQVHSSGRVNQTDRHPAPGSAELFPIATSSISLGDEQKLFKYFEVFPTVLICNDGVELNLVSRA